MKKLLLTLLHLAVVIRNIPIRPRLRWSRRLLRQVIFMVQPAQNPRRDDATVFGEAMTLFLSLGRIR